MQFDKEEIHNYFLDHYGLIRVYPKDSHRHKITEVVLQTELEKEFQERCKILELAWNHLFALGKSYSETHNC